MAKGAVFKLFLLFFSILLSLIMAEVLFRLSGNITKVYYSATWTSPAIFVESAEGFSLLPDKSVKHYSLYKDYIAQYTTNSQGIRSRCEYARGKPKNTKRIFVLGNSFAFGLGVNDNETLASALEERLNQNSQNGIRYEVLNLAITGHVFDNCYVRLKKYLSLKPDLIIYIKGALDFYEIIDHDWVLDKNKDIISVKENSRHIDKYHRYVNGPKNLYTQNTNIFFENIREFLRSHSVMYAFFGSLKYRNRLKRVDLESRQKNIETEIKGLDCSVRVLDRLFELTTKNQIKTLFILETFDNKTVKEKFLSYLSQKTDSIIDVDDFNKVEGLRLPRDGHWSAFGNSYIANFVFKYLKDNHIL